MQPMSVYVHVPFCVRRCGYCDFNTYTPRELGGAVSQADYADQVITEIKLAAQFLDGDKVVQSRKPSGVPTVFFGGGTPTMLPSSDLVKILREIDNTWGLMPDAEVTTEANPDSVTQESINELAQGGFTRMSFGMQSAVPHVLHTLDRTHNHDQIPIAVNWAKQAGLKVSVDLIYGTPGESLDDWRESLETAIATGVDHISAYALHVEPHTKMGRQILKRQLPAPDDDDEAAKYELADELLNQAGLEWYEISNWACGGIGGNNACQHNLAYWRGQNWWGLGPGAHSYLAESSAEEASADAMSKPRRAYRWWNVKHPAKYAQMLSEDRLPIEEVENLTPEQIALENVMLGLRLAEGLPIEALEASFRDELGPLGAQGLLVFDGNQLTLTRRGRLLADTVVRKLT